MIRVHKDYFSVTFAPSQVCRKYTTLFSGLANLTDSVQVIAIFTK